MLSYRNTGLVDLAKKLKEDFDENPLSRNAFLADINSRFNQNLKNSALNFPYHTSGSRFKLINSVMNSRLVPMPRKDNDHPAAKFFDQYYKYVMANHLLNRDVVLFIGAKLKEVIDFCFVKPNIIPIVIFGDIDGEDLVRDIENLRLAQRILEKKEDEKYYPFDGIFDAYNKSLNHLPTKVRLLAHDFINYYEGRQSQFFFSRKNLNGRKLKQADVMIAANSIYDISPSQLSYYMKKFRVKFCLASRISCADLFKLGSSVNDLLGVRFDRVAKGKVAMCFTEGQSKGYVHSETNMEMWNLFTKFKTPNGLLWYEHLDAKLNFELLIIHMAKVQDFDRYMCKSMQQSSYVRLVKIEKFLKYNQIEYFYVDRLKFSRIKDYCLRISLDSFEPAKITTMATALKNQIIVGDMEIQIAWDLDETTFNEVIKFVIVYTSLLRGEFLDLVVNSIELSKKSKHLDWRLIQAFRLVRDTITMKKESWLIRSELDKLISLPQLFIWEPNSTYSYERILNKLFSKDFRIAEKFPVSATEQNNLYSRQQLNEAARRKYYFGCAYKVAKFACLSSTCLLWAPSYVSYKIFNKYVFNVPEKFSEYYGKIDEFGVKALDFVYRILEKILVLIGALEDISDCASNDEQPDEVGTRVLDWLDRVEIDEDGISSEFSSAETYSLKTTTTDTSGSSSSGGAPLGVASGSSSENSDYSTISVKFDLKGKGAVEDPVVPKIVGYLPKASKGRKKNSERKRQWRQRKQLKEKKD